MSGAPPYSFGSDMLPGLAKLVEETGELNVVLGKLLMTGGDPAYFDGRDLKEELADEIADVYAALDFFTAAGKGVVDMAEVMRRREEKLAQFVAWAREQRE